MGEPEVFPSSGLGLHTVLPPSSDAAKLPASRLKTPSPLSVCLLWRISVGKIGVSWFVITTRSELCLPLICKVSANILVTCRSSTPGQTGAPLHHLHYSRARGEPLCSTHWLR